MPRSLVRVIFMIVGVLAIAGAVRADHVIHVDDDAPAAGDGSSWSSKSERSRRPDRVRGQAVPNSC